MPETFNLDRAFDDLTRDLTTATHPRGAGVAMRSARRRRSAVGGAAAVALLAVGGVVAGQLLDQPQTAGPSHEAVEEQLPAAAPFDVAALEAASQGWISGWRSPADDTSTEAPCLDTVVVPSNPIGLNPDRDNRFRSGSDVAATRVLARFATETAARQTFSVLTDAVGRCPMSDGRLDLAMPSGSMASVLSFDDNITWYVQTGDRICVFNVARAVRAPSNVVQATMARALLAGMIGYDDWQQLDQSDPASGSASASGGPEVEASRR